jgi:hypothetical protein
VPSFDDSAEIINLADARMEREFRQAIENGVKPLLRFIASREQEMHRLMLPGWLDPQEDDRTR